MTNTQLNRLLSLPFYLISLTFSGNEFHLKALLKLKLRLRTPIAEDTFLRISSTWLDQESDNNAY